MGSAYLRCKEKLVMKLKQLLYLFTSLGVLPACGQETLEKKLELLYNNSVPLIQPAELERWTSREDSLIILDTRSASEYQVSHIRNARFIDYDSFDTSMISDLPKSSKVVVYCSVGYRSERVGEKLKAQGFEEVYNLYGGIFQWKNHGYTVVNNENQPTDSVHAYNKLWGQWLKKGIKVYD